MMKVENELAMDRKGFFRRMEVCLGMKKSLFLVVLLSLLSGLAFSQQDFKLHSHNDYLRNVPFWEAFGAGAASIEVDVILQDGQLMVAHEKESVKPEWTLKSLYLEQIQKARNLGMMADFSFHLLVDCKTEAYSTLEQVVKDGAEFKEMMYSAQNPTGLKLIISGNRPKPADYEKYPEWIYFDYQSKILTADLPWKKIGMVSLSFSQFSKWKGQGTIPVDEKSELEAFIGLVHSFDRPVRFWASPDGEVAWKTFYELGVDYINTDRPREAVEFFLSND